MKFIIKFFRKLFRKGFGKDVNVLVKQIQKTTKEASELVVNIQKSNDKKNVEIAKLTNQVNDNNNNLKQTQDLIGDLTTILCQKS